MGIGHLDIRTKADKDCPYLDTDLVPPTIRDAILVTTKLRTFEGLQLKYWLILDKEGDMRKRVGTERCIGQRFKDDNQQQQDHALRASVHS